ncbi:MAG: (Fe-S)-binding protein [Gammaproteobacteria bacterium]|nr:(Fe-S)-binding protein [Gammaproteobacteria bacterium]
MNNKSLSATNRCVMCGLCLPHCPTYLKTRNEADSPRGRISLIRALSDDHLPAGTSLVRHLEGCLSCRACETVCPAKVPYGELIDGAREILNKGRSWKGRFALILADLLVSRRRLRMAISWLLSLTHRSGLPHALISARRPIPSRLKRAAAFLGPMPVQAIHYHKAPSPPNDDAVIALFTGCIAEILDRDTLSSSIHLLKTMGYNPWIPRHQTCCGAIHQHNGQPGKAMKYMRRNLTAFEHPRLAAVLSMATGCGAQLSEYRQYLPLERGKPFSNKHADICTFLASRLPSQQLKFNPLRSKVAIHIPCSQNYILKNQTAPFEILSLIPEIDLVELPNNGYCCGAAGSYMLTQVDMADALLGDKLIEIDNLKPSIIVTSNIGCRLHLQAGLRRKGLNIEVIHPVTLLARQNA